MPVLVFYKKFTEIYRKFPLLILAFSPEACQLCNWLPLTKTKNTINFHMETQTVYTNGWKAFHDSLEDAIAKKYKEQIERVLGISQSAFYRKIKDPQKFLSIAEKQAIARVYNLKDMYLFPELAKEERITVNG
jgi:hypothetical protein